MSRFEPTYIAACVLVIVGLVISLLNRRGSQRNINFAVLNRNNRQNIRQAAPQEPGRNDVLGTMMALAGVLVALAQLFYDIFGHARS
jgi:sensor domain CHASE-containing protein